MHNLQENENNVHHTALTYCHILKIKKEEPKSKLYLLIETTSYFSDKILPLGKYNGKFDRVKLNQLMNSQWKNMNIIKK